MRHASGAYACQRLHLLAKGKACGRDAKASNRTWEIRPSGIIGGLRKRSHGGNAIPTRNRKSGLGNPPPTAGASEFYPNHRQVNERFYGLLSSIIRYNPVGAYKMHPLIEQVEELFLPEL